MPLAFIRFAFLKEHSGCKVKKSLEGDKTGYRKWLEWHYRYVGGYTERQSIAPTWSYFPGDQGECELTCRPLRKCHIALWSRLVQKASWHYLEKNTTFMLIKDYLPTWITNAIPVFLSRSFSKWTETLPTQSFLSSFPWNIVIFLKYTKIKINMLVWIEKQTSKVGLGGTLNLTF